MAHNIARIAGTDQAWYADKPAWHGLGTVTAGAKTAAQVQKAVPQFRRDVELAPVYAKVGGKFVEFPNRFATHRSGMNAPTDLMGIVSGDYEKLTDADALRTLEAVIVEASKRAKAGFVTAGLLGNGARGFASIELSRVIPIRIKRDPSKHQSHLFGDWTHDGTGAMHAGLWNNRVECNNMLDAALADATRKGVLVSIRHAGDVAAQIEEAQRTLGLAELAVKAHVEQMNALQDVVIAKPKLFLPGFTEFVIPMPEDAGERAARSREEARDVIKSLFASSKTLVGVPQSAYRAYQAVAEYADHYRPLRIGPDVPAEQAADRRFRSITEGPAAEMKARALDYLQRGLELAASSN